MILLRQIHELMTLQGLSHKQGRGALKEEDLGLIKDAAMVLDGGRILWVGPQKKLPREFFKIKRSLDIKSHLFPGFIDCHTHSVFYGDRTHEFEKRIQGQTYQQIAKEGGGISHTVRETRKASQKELMQKLEERLQTFAKQGVTTVEIKSGYGLSLKEELRLLEVIQKAKTPLRKISTFLGAHSRPPEFSNCDDYLLYLEKNLQQVWNTGLSRRVDIFVEKNYFSLKKSKEYLKKAQALGFDITIHADQMSRTGATLLAVELGARSADHVICLNKKDINTVAKSSLTCVFLPTADFYLNCPYPPARELIDQGARFALATDFNPGTSPTQNIQWVGLLARQEMKMTLPEVFSGFTLGAAYALGIEKECGPLKKGYSADFFVCDRDWDQFFYDLNPLEIQSLWVRGKASIASNKLT